MYPNTQLTCVMFVTLWYFFVFDHCMFCISPRMVMSEAKLTSVRNFQLMGACDTGMFSQSWAFHWSIAMGHGQRAFQSGK